MDSIDEDKNSWSDFEDYNDDEFENDQEKVLDLTDALVNFESSSKLRYRNATKAEDEGEGDDEDDDDAFFKASAQRSNLKLGNMMLKSKKSHNQSKSITGGGSFQSMGLHPSLLRAIILRGFNTPTPIQRAILPQILASPPRDVVGMARTGSGKTLAYMIPLIQKLGAHSIEFGARALVMVPTRELAIQVLKVGKDLSKGFLQGVGNKSSNGDAAASSKPEGLRWGLVVGGYSLEEQFAMFASNPDVVIATPGRLLHLAVEMKLDFRSITYAGLQNPKLIRLDSESKISSDLQMAFLSVKPNEKEAALMVLIGDIIKVPKLETMEQTYSKEGFHSGRQNFGKRRPDAKDDKKSRNPIDQLAPHQTIVFAATKHHVEFLSGILTSAGYPVSHIYGTLDQTARQSQLNAFRSGRTRILVVTDLGARGIDIPILENVINYDFPSSSRAFVHRVGRTARAGRKGWAYSLVTQTELPFLMDLQLFLSRPLVTCPIASHESVHDCNFSSNLVLGTIPRDRLDAETEYVRETLVSPDSSLLALDKVVKRAQKMYEKSQSKASAESYRRSKALVQAERGLAGTSGEEAAAHLIFCADKKDGKRKKTASDAREKLLAKVNGYTPTETVFEIGTRGKSPAARLMRDRRKSVGKVIDNRKEALEEVKKKNIEIGEIAEQFLEKKPETDDETDSRPKLKKKRAPEIATEAELEDTFEMPRKRKRGSGETFRDKEAYLTYERPGTAAEKGYALNEGTATAFAIQAGAASFDLGDNDEARLTNTLTQKASQVRWDRKTKKFVKVGQLGADNKALIKTESGAKLPASFKSGSFEAWKKRERVRIPSVGEEEVKGRKMTEYRRFRNQTQNNSSGGGSNSNGRMSTNNRDRIRGRDRVTEKLIDGQRKSSNSKRSSVFKSGISRSNKQNPKHREDRNNGGLRTVQQIRKQRNLKEIRKRRSNNQPGRKR
ncbi:P-loop containing nucleoside triphosphate hydrolase protein [Phakopsora pachyrhizi]|uniref:RNA helicase n=1 Tax=Phakopsora pachyrhizi TaxID=170000 RepID=A0AAV0B6C0_PHAPC|nr:P-loop containing nucleoside triphosphate hydrolase protein [Phakopsora pachyrhizi]